MQFTIRDLLIQTSLVAGFVAAATVLHRLAPADRLPEVLFLLIAMGCITGTSLGGLFRQYQLGALIGAASTGLTVATAMML
jgi:hypothetical protein